MAYEKQTWINGSSKLSADRMNHIENGIESVENEIPTSTEDLTNDSGFITKSVNNLTNYELKTNTGTSIALSIDSSTYVMTLNLKNSNGDILSTGTIDLPLETMVVNASYDSTTKSITLTLQNGTTTSFSVADLVSGLENLSNKVTTITNSSTDTQYPSAKAVYDYVSDITGNINSTLTNILGV